MINITNFSIRSSIILTMAGISYISSSPHDDVKFNSPAINEYRADYGKSPVISSAIYIPRKNYFKMYDNFRKSRLFQEVYNGKSVGDGITIED